MAEEVRENDHEVGGRLIYVYRNGDRFKNYKRYVVNHKTVRTLDYLFNELTKLLQPDFGAVRSLRTPTHGHPIDSLDELQGGRSYVAAGHGRFIHLPYEKARSLAEFNVPGRVKHSADPYGAPKPVLIKPVKHSRVVASGKVKKDPGDSFFIHVYINGDDISPAIKVRLLAAERSVLMTVLNAVNKKVHTQTGAVLRLYSLNGERIRNIEEIQNGASYVAVGREKQFRTVEYGKHSLPVWHAGTHVPTPISPVGIDKINENASGNAAASTITESYRQTRRPAEGAGANRTSNQPLHHGQANRSPQKHSNVSSTLSLQEKDSVNSSNKAVPQKGEEREKKTPQPTAAFKEDANHRGQSKIEKDFEKSSADKNRLDGNKLDAGSSLYSEIAIGVVKVEMSTDKRKEHRQAVGHEETQAALLVDWKREIDDGYKVTRSSTNHSDKEMMPLHKDNHHQRYLETEMLRKSFIREHDRAEESNREHYYGISGQQASFHYDEHQQNQYQQNSSEYLVRRKAPSLDENVKGELYSHRDRTVPTVQLQKDGGSDGYMPFLHQEVRSNAHRGHISPPTQSNFVRNQRRSEGNNQDKKIEHQHV